MTKALENGIKRLIRGYHEEVDQVYSDFMEKYYHDRMTLEEMEDVIIDMMKCSQCGCYEVSEWMVDTEGVINGGVGMICWGCNESN